MFVCLLQAIAYVFSSFFSFFLSFVKSLRQIRADNYFIITTVEVEYSNLYHRRIDTSTVE